MIRRYRIVEAEWGSDAQGDRAHRVTLESLQTGQRYTLTLKIPLASELLDVASGIDAFRDLLVTAASKTGVKAD